MCYCACPGLFRDAFGETMRLLATVPKRLAEQDEPPEYESHPRIMAARQRVLCEAGTCTKAKRLRRAALRVFSSEPGLYGTGLLPLIDAGNWSIERRFDRCFLQMGRVRL